MELQLIRETTGLLAKEKGYTDNTKYWSYFDEEHKSWFSTNVEGSIDGTQNTFKRPTQALLQKWLREIHNIHINPEYAAPDTNKYCYRIDTIDPCKCGIYSKRRFITHEEALEIGLQAALELI